MFTLASLIAALTIAGAFWVGILAARRLRDWGDGRALAEGNDPLALPAGAAGSAQVHPPADPMSQRIRARVAQRLQGRMPAPVPRALPAAADANAAADARDLAPTELRQGDVVIVDGGDPALDGDFVIAGVLTLREGPITTIVTVMTDANRERWLVSSPALPRWLLLAPVPGHGLFGEPPRHILRDGQDFALERRGQASAAGVGHHGRPALPRVATYVYRAPPERMLWLERWGDQVLMGEGIELPDHFVSFLPGS